RTADADTSMPSAPASSPPARTLFTADPVVDGSILSLSAGWAVLSTMIIGTGEIRPQQIDPNFNTNNLLFLDKSAVTQKIDPHAKSVSNIGLGVAIGYAVLDPIFSGIREKNAGAGFIDALIYSESIAITAGMTNLSKLAVRRPRPIAYIEFNQCRKKH